MRITFWFSGPAWAWVNTSWLLLADVLAKKWYYIYCDKEYSSVIKGWNNLFIVYISDSWKYISKNIDHYFHFDDLALEKNSEIYSINAKYKVTKEQAPLENIYSFWAALNLLWIPREDWISAMEERFGSKGKEDNIASFDAWFLSVKGNIENLSDAVWIESKMYYWNEVIADWAIAAWMDYYSAYPMTPASTLIDAVLANPKKITFNQGEDEIAVAMSMLWAKFAWARAMCGTSGWWFALMSESISFSNIAEIWWVYVLSMRAGPSTGTPTFTWQWDIDYALVPTFWDTFPIVIVPSTFEDWYNLVWKALNWSDKYAHPVIILLDKQYSEWYCSVPSDMLIPAEIDRWKLLLEPKTDFARYSLENIDWISPYTVPWTKDWEFITSSYEHDEFGKETEKSELKVKMEDKRATKLETFVKEEYDNEFFGYEIINHEAEEFYVSFLSNRFAIDSALENDKTKWAIYVKVLFPLDPRLEAFLNEKSRKLVFVEENRSWQFERHLRDNIDLSKHKITNLRKYDLYPFFEENFK